MVCYCVTSITENHPGQEYLCPMVKKLFGILIICLFSAQLVLANKDESHAKSDSSVTSVSDFLKKGTLRFHSRTFFMHTLNQGDLIDFGSTAFGAGIGYFSPEFKGFSVGFSGFFAFKLYDYNLTEADPLTGGGNRYEVLLYDLNDLENASDLDRLEDLFVKYRFKGFSAIFGRQIINTPLLNAQDNRMRPNHFSGLTLQYQNKGWEFFGGLYSHVVMRGTVDWYTIEHSLGVYPFGRSPLGVPSGYKDNVESEGIGILNVTWKSGENLKAQVWNYAVDNIFNLTFAQVDHRIGQGLWGLDIGLQGFYQLPVNHGGNADQEKTYIHEDERGLGVGGKLGISDEHHQISLNFLRIGAQGRFLFPREWGREIFYASLSRERFEGTGDVTAFALKYHQKFFKDRLKGELAASAVNNPSINDFQLNKYGLPDYYHFTAGVHYHFGGYLEGLDLTLLAVHKIAQRPDEVPDNFRLNRVEMWNLNAILNFHF